SRPSLAKIPGAANPVCHPSGRPLRPFVGTGSRSESSRAEMARVPTYEVYAIKYAHHPRRASENFVGGDPHDGPMPLDYFVWLIRGPGREVVVDTGFSAAVAARRGRQHLR